LASGVPLKQIQEWLGHSDFAITANTYAHLEFNPKMAAAQSMTWIEKTALAPAKQPLLLTDSDTEKKTDFTAIASSLPAFLHSLFASNVSVEMVDAWLKEADFARSQSFEDSFKHFSQTYTATV
jgi:hypothetical protein